MSTSPFKKTIMDYPDMELFVQRLANHQDWRAVDPVVRKSILDVSHLLKSIDQRMLYLQTSLQNRISIQVGQLVKQKVGMQQIHNVVRDCTRLGIQLNQKPSYEDVKDIVSKNTIKMLQPLQKSQRKNTQRFQIQLRALRARLDDIDFGMKQETNDMLRLHQSYKRLQKKIIDGQQGLRNQMLNQLQQSKLLKEDSSKTKLRSKKSNLQQIKSSHLQICENLTRISSKISEATEKPQARFLVLQNRVSTLEFQIKAQQSQDKSVITKRLTKLNDQMVVQKQLCELRHKQVESRHNQLAKSQPDDLLQSGRLESILAQVERVTKQLDGKVSFKDIQALAQRKAEPSKFQQRLSQLQYRFQDNKVGVDNVLRQQSKINQILCSQCSFGRWIWHSGNTLHGKISWEVELRNLVPDFIVWNKGDTGIRVKQSGIYRLTICFLTSGPYSIQVLINKERHQTLQREQRHSNTQDMLLSLQAESLIEHIYRGEDAIGLFFLQKL